MFKIKDGYKLDVQMPEIMKLFGSKKNKKKTYETKYGENKPCLEVVTVVFRAAKIWHTLMLCACSAPK